MYLYVSKGVFKCFKQVFKRLTLLMPRRIPDYPDAFSGWNEISSYGSIVSVMATIIFGIALYNTFVSEKTANNVHWGWANYWTPAPIVIAGDASRGLATSMEWVLRSPTPHHSYDDPVLE